MKLEEASESVKRFARQHSKGIIQKCMRNFCEEDFFAGMAFWTEIKRDADGFATDECLDEMFANMPFLIFDADDNDIEAVCQDDWRGEVETKSYYTHWKPIPLPKINHQPQNNKPNGKTEQ